MLQHIMDYITKIRNYQINNTTVFCFGVPFLVITINVK